MAERFDAVIVGAGVIGAAVALDGTRIACGVPGDDDKGSASGAAL